MNAQTLFEQFPYRYVGGGYYRDKRVPPGEPAPTLHGDEALRKMAEFASENLTILPPFLPTHLHCIASDSCQSHQETPL
jgi:hypothetical protein